MPTTNDVVKRGPITRSTAWRRCDSRVDAWGTVRFTQNSIGQAFSDGGSVLDLAHGLESGGADATGIEPIRIFEQEGDLYSLDNRRLFAGQFADEALPFRWATPEEVSNETWKFTTTNGGTGITMRGVGPFSWMEP